MNKKFHITIKDNEDGTVYMDDDVGGILGSVIMDEKSVRGVLQMSPAFRDTFEESALQAFVNANCVKSAIYAITKLLERDRLTQAAYLALKDESFDCTVAIDFNAIKKANGTENGTDKE